MCGLCGVVALDRAPETTTVERMLALLAHRGPDDEGIHAGAGVALGGRRLAVLDLSVAGHQPFASEDRRLQLVHNGEIYNYRELRSELESHGHRFRSGTDTEVVLAAYREWGENCVRRFNGMWAFALWDDDARRLFCSRDRFGIKPFYYRHENGRFVFASELKAFRADSATALAPNLARVRDYLEHALIDHTDETFFAGIRRLPPAHSLVLDADGLRLGRYWRLEAHEPPDDAADAVREAFLDSLLLQLRSDVPLGTCLSGGLDSSAIACGIDLLLRTGMADATPVGPQQRTVTAYFEQDGFDERPYAETVVARIGAEAALVSFSASELVEDLPQIVEAQDEPFGSTSVAAQWYVMRTARQTGLTVMLDGQGGDELFAGYPGHLPALLAGLVRRGHFAELWAQVAAQRRLRGPGPATVAVLRAFLPASVERSVAARVGGGAGLVHPDLPRVAAGDPDESPFGGGLHARLWTGIVGRGLPELLRYEDRNSMAHSLEARVPFLDHRLVELALSLAERDLIDRGVTKAVLRRALRDVVPAPVLARTDKLGFVTPEADWLRADLGELATDVFASTSFAQRGFVRAAATRRRLERHRAGELTAGFELWRALNLELWARAFLDR